MPDWRRSFARKRLIFSTDNKGTFWVNSEIIVRNTLESMYLSCSKQLSDHSRPCGADGKQVAETLATEEGLEYSVRISIDNLSQ